MKKVLSFGAGVQSTVLLLMSCKGELPKLDCAVFADTGWEPEKVYEHLKWCIMHAESHGIPVYVTKANKRGIREETLHNHLNEEGSGFVSIPLRILGDDGKKGIGRRQCTREYKIAPVDKTLREKVLGLKFRQRAPKVPVIEQWMGITKDEIMRAKPARVKWKEHVFPFLSMGCEYLDKDWRRDDCYTWLEQNYPEIEVPRSACIGCPYRRNEEWKALTDEEFEDACKFDETLREMGGKGKQVDQYLHYSYKPLRDVDLRTDAEKGQPDLWNNECEGMCGI